MSRLVNCPFITRFSCYLPNYIVTKNIGMSFIGEGQRPLFERDDVKVNAIADDGVVAHKFKNLKHSSPPRSYTCNKTRSIDQRQSTEKIKSTRKHEDVKYKKSEDECHSNLKNRLYTEVQQRNKVPYFKDPVRERDRKRRLYGSPSGLRSRSPTPEYSKRRISHRSRNSPKSRRSVSRNRHRSHSPYRSNRRSPTYNRSRRRSGTRSPSRDRSKRRSSERSRKGMEKDNIYHRVAREESNRMMPPTPVIQLPVRGIPEYSCPYHGSPQMWAPPVGHRFPPPFYAPYHSIMIPTLRPSPHQTYGSISPTIPFVPMHPAAYRPYPVRYSLPRQNANASIRNKKPYS